jgi:hypothetical protein
VSKHRALSWIRGVKRPSCYNKRKGPPAQQIGRDAEVPKLTNLIVHERNERRDLPRANRSDTRNASHSQGRGSALRDVQMRAGWDHHDKGKSIADERWKHKEQTFTASCWHKYQTVAPVQCCIDHLRSIVSIYSTATFARTRQIQRR